MRARVVGSLCLLALIAPGAPEAAPETALQWLQRTEKAVRETDFRGTFVYQHGNHLETIRVFHKTSSDGHRERLVSLTGPAREVIRDRNGVNCILPGSDSLVLRDRHSAGYFPSGLVTDSEALSEGYRVGFAGTDRIADRRTVRVSAVPRDEYRYGHRLWLDRVSGIPLKSELIDGEGRALERVMFTEFEEGVEISDRELEPADATNAVSDPAPARQPVVSRDRILEGSRLNVTWMPPGFRLLSEQTKALAGGDGHVRHMVYSDGLASVSLFLERAGQESGMLEGGSRMGAVNAFGRPVGGHVQLTVVGEVPGATVRRIAESVVLSEPSGQ